MISSFPATREGAEGEGRGRAEAALLGRLPGDPRLLRVLAGADDANSRQTEVMTSWGLFDLFPNVSLR